MTALVWDDLGNKLYELGVSKGVLYVPNASGVYTPGVAWNGLTKVTESPSGAEATTSYADNIAYAQLLSAEKFEGTIQAYTYPDEFGVCDGSYSPADGVNITMQPRKSFGMSYRTEVGNDVDGQSHGYKLHLLYGVLAQPSEKEYDTINDSPSAMNFSWKITTSPVDVPGHKATALITINSTKADPADLAKLEGILYGSSTGEARLPLPTEIISIFGASAAA